MSQSAESKMPKCFVIMPFSDAFTNSYHRIFIPAIRAAGYEPKRGDEIYGPRVVIESVVREIREADAILAELTGKNPNVNYELGIADTLKRPVVLVSQTMDDVPFDYRHRGVVTYHTADVDWQDKLSKSITEHILAIEPAAASTAAFLAEYAKDRIICGVGISGTDFDFRHMLTADREEIIAIGTNLRVLLSDEEFKSRIVTLIESRNSTKVTLICATKAALEPVSARGVKHLQQSVVDLMELRNRLNESNRGRLAIHFHPDAVSLSGMIVDPKNDKRAVLIFTPRFASDAEPDNRVYCVVEKQFNRAVFNKISGSIIVLTQNDSLSLEQMRIEFGLG